MSSAGRPNCFIGSCAQVNFLQSSPKTSDPEVTEMGLLHLLLITQTPGGQGLIQDQCPVRPRPPSPSRAPYPALNPSLLSRAWHLRPPVTPLLCLLVQKWKLHSRRRRETPKTSPGCHCPPGKEPCAGVTRTGTHTRGPLSSQATLCSERHFSFGRWE